MTTPDVYEILSWAIAILFWRKVFAVESEGIPGTWGPGHDHDLATETGAGQAVEGAQVRGVAADLGTASGVEAFVREVPEADVLVNNLGIFEAKPFGEIPDADWMRFFEVGTCRG